MANESSCKSGIQLVRSGSEQSQQVCAWDFTNSCFLTESCYARNGLGRGVLEVLREVYKRNKENKLSERCLKKCWFSDCEVKCFMRNLIIYACIGCLRCVGCAGCTSSFSDNFDFSLELCPLCWTCLMYLCNALQLTIEEPWVFCWCMM